MDAARKTEELREDAEISLARLRGISAEDLKAMKNDVESLRNTRQYDLMGKLAESLSRRDPEDAKNRRFYAQYLIETGNVTAAIDVLRMLMKRLKPHDLEFAEASGLIGRAYKQIFFEAHDKSSDEARRALKGAIAAYRRPYEANPTNTWHGANLVALNCARRLDMATARGLDPKEIAQGVVTTLEAVPFAKRDIWHAATLGEAYLGLGNWDAFEREMKAYVAGPDVRGFLVASTLRQMTQIWDLEATGERGRSIVAALRTQLLVLDGEPLLIDPRSLNRIRAFEPQKETLEAILGRDGPKTYKWMQSGMKRAMAVASISLKNVGRVGSGFLVRAGEFGLKPDNELLVLTNWHVVNADGLHPGIRPETAEVVFEAVNAPNAYDVAKIVWTSRPALHDAAFLRLAGDPSNMEPMALAKSLPAIQPSARVYVIGYPGGRELSLSLQDNELLDHEGPPAGKPQIPGVCRVHYRTPTEPGSSGSPVFEGDLWSVVALHHAGSKTAMTMLNGKAGSYAANEAVSIGSIKEAIATTPEGFP